MSSPAPTPSQPALIRPTKFAVETPGERLLKKTVPAVVVSGGVHVALVAAMLGTGVLLEKPAGATPSDAQLTVVTDDTPPPEKELDLTNPDIGLDSELPAAVMNDNLQDVNVDTQVVTPDPPGVDAATAAAPMEFLPPPGVGAPSLDPGSLADTGTVAIGAGGGGSGTVANAAFNGRSAATRSKLLNEGGGNKETEAAVANGLIWLARQQKGSGAWVFDGGGSSHVTASTGLALLPFLAAGQTHKFSKDNKYKANVEAGLKFLVAQQKKTDGSFSQNMYAHAIATVAVCEALGMTGDKGFLLRPAQQAVNFIQQAQGADGSWGYGPNSNGDTSIVGWQVQALHSAKLCKELVVDKRTFDRARGFLNKVASGPAQSRYGYSTPGASPTLTPVGLLCRYYMDGWGPTNPGLAAGVQFLGTMPPKAEGLNMYYLYYASQVVHFFGGVEWQQWNPTMQKVMLGRQVKMEKGANGGSWDPDSSIMGEQTGRLGTTCLSLLTLEVYYRPLPLYKRDAAGMKELERVK